MADDEMMYKRIFGDSDSEDDGDYQPGAADEEIPTDRVQQILSSKPAPKQKRKRLQKKETKRSQSAGPSGEGASTDQPEGGGGYADADQDSLSGSEAMEDNTQNETEGDGFASGKRKKGQLMTRDKMNEEIRVSMPQLWGCRGCRHKGTLQSCATPPHQTM